ncbi:hypothetical protein [Candidatus Contubernalis alkaliaceticus]|uniref:hypothetical protein n=1 Tax=Candidatus Contubernalis alkaliaceticus TaxID=338645 RepID=UPI001F4BEC97|nr:hypothetical protein [Candidatus Contubernalis alkalaceticus]UNC93542.1 hypothetical protein HUE98_16540 [Candidatus Contubernalis alkalaceticus]
MKGNNNAFWDGKPVKENFQPIRLIEAHLEKEIDHLHSYMSKSDRKKLLDFMIQNLYSPSNILDHLPDWENEIFKKEAIPSKRKHKMKREKLLKRSVQRVACASLTPTPVEFLEVLKIQIELFISNPKLSGLGILLGALLSWIFGPVNIFFAVPLTVVLFLLLGNLADEVLSSSTKKGLFIRIKEIMLIGLSYLIILGLFNVLSILIISDYWLRNISFTMVAISAGNQLICLVSSWELVPIDSLKKQIAGFLRDSADKIDSNKKY